MAGCLNCRVDGQSFSIVAENRDLIFCDCTLRVLLALRRNVRQGSSHLFKILKLADVRVGIRLGGLGTISVPARSKWLQLFLWRN
jgi:hypothetical protein